jgi:hypothetical protein
MFAAWSRIILFAILCPLGVGAANAQGKWYYTVFFGVMTENRWHEVFSPGDLQLAASDLVGLGIGWDRQIAASRFRYGFEMQALRHFGRQDHYEFNLPIVLRYVPANPVPRWLKTVAFGIGVSHATKVPQVEIDRKGESQRNFVYWMADVQFVQRRPGTSVYFRLHHRSDGYGLYDVSSGSTALVLGWLSEF